MSGESHVGKTAAFLKQTKHSSLLMAPNHRKQSSCIQQIQQIYQDEAFFF